MPRGFLAGVVSGGVVGALGLAGISLVLPPPKAPVPQAVSSPASQADSAVEVQRGEGAPIEADTGSGRSGAGSGVPAPETAITAPPAAVPSEASEAPVEDGANAPPQAVVSDENQDAAVSATPAPADDAVAEADAAADPVESDPLLADTATAETEQEAVTVADPAEEEQPSDTRAAEAQPAPQGDATAQAAPPQSADLSPAVPETPVETDQGADASDAAQAAADGATPAENPVPESDATPEVASPESGALPQATTPTGEAAADRPRLLQPAPALSDAAEGVTRNRLPSIGSAPAEIIDETQPMGDALTRNARSFANPSGRPPFAVLLLDDGSIATADLATIAASKLPLTLVVDPAGAEAAERAALWRAAGQEVALLADAIAAGAKGSDGEIAVEAMVNAIPQALALVAPTAESALQSDRMAAAAVVPALAARGFGLVTWDQGLNAADQVARREGLAAATIYRDLSGRDDSGPVMTRALDRAAFKAQQDGRALVFGRLDPATIEALLSWSLSARAASLTPAPLSAVLK